MNKFKMIIVGVITILGIVFLVYNGLYPKAKERLLRNEEEYLIYITSSSCAYCQSIKDEVKLYEDKINENSNLLPYYKIDLDYVASTNPKREFGITGTPTLFHIKNGRVLKQASGTEKVLQLFADIYGKVE